MKTNVGHLLLSLAVCANVACAESTDATVVPPDKITTDTGVIEVSAVDSAVPETTPDTAVADTMADTIERCAYPATETTSCGMCGTQSRFCLPEGAWTGFTACAGEIADGECSVGDKRTSECGKCGKSMDTCDPKTCKWVEGFCAGEGPCTEGDEELTRASCTMPAEVRIRTCDSKCQWSPFAPCAVQRGWLPMTIAPITGRSRHAAVWTGSRMIVWGGYGASPSYKSDGAAYDPLGDKWSTIAAAPSVFSSGRRDPRAVWTGSTMIVFGGRDGSEAKKDVAVYDPSADSWTTGSTTTLAGRWGGAVVWSTTTNQLLVWGGCTNTSCSSVTGDGAAYDPATDTWAALPAAPIVARGELTAVWTGSEMLVFGGYNEDDVDLADGARYNPSTRTWTKFSPPPSGSFAPRFDLAATWTGSALAVWGGRTSTTSASIQSNGAVYTPMIGWSLMSSPTDMILPGGAVRYDHVMFHDAGKLYVFSGISSASTSATSGMAAYDIATSNWTNVDTTKAPAARARATVVWTGREAIVFGGGATDSTSTTFNTGGMYRP